MRDCDSCPICPVIVAVLRARGGRLASREGSNSQGRTKMKYPVVGAMALAVFGAAPEAREHADSAERFTNFCEGTVSVFHRVRDR